MTWNGYTVIARENSTLAVDAVGNSAEDNARTGFSFATYGNMSIQYIGNESSDNTLLGAFGANGNGSLSVMVQNSVIADNDWYAFHIDDNTSGAFNVDLGGGTLGSEGNNSIYGNGGGTPLALRLDLDGGQISARHNWWGQPGGPLPGQIANEGACPNCGTADTSSPLDHDPNL